MTSELVKIGLPRKQAEGERRVRRMRQILEQHDAAIARVNAATNERMRQELAAPESESDESDTPATTTAAATA